MLIYISRKRDKVTEKRDVMPVAYYRTLFSLPTVGRAGKRGNHRTYFTILVTMNKRQELLLVPEPKYVVIQSCR